MTHSTLILGGGVAGLVVANRLRKALPRSHRIMMVEREAAFVFVPSLLWLMTGDRTRAGISRPIVRLERKGIDVITGEIECLDPVARQAVVGGRTLTGDQLVIALGADLAPENIAGLAEAGHNLYTLAGAEALRDALATFKGGRLVVLTAAPAYKCPAAPYEAAMLIEAYCRRRGIRETTTIEVYAAEPGPMGTAGPDASQGVRQMVEAKGIGYRPEHQIVRADPEARKLFFANGNETEYDLLVYVPPHRAPRVVQAAGLVGDSGWIAVDRQTLATTFAGVYALGDVVGIPLKIGKPLPKAGVFAHAQAEVVAHNITHQVTGKGKPAIFNGHGGCFIEVGDGQAAFGNGNFYGDPKPQVTMYRPGWYWHLAKILFEKDFFWRWL